jgi:rubrerythrin
VTATRSAPRPCPLCGNPTATPALVETHVGPTRQHPNGDVVVWLCPSCAVEVTDPDQPQPPDKGQPR